MVLTRLGSTTFPDPLYSAVDNALFLALICIHATLIAPANLIAHFVVLALSAIFAGGSQ